MPQRDPKTDPRGFLGDELRRARVAAGFASQEALAARLNLDRTVITKSESGERSPSPDVLAAWCTECNVSDPGLYTRLTALARSADGPIPRWFEDWLAAEAVAQLVRDWAPIIIPALFHTAAYARELLLKAQTDVSDEHVSALVDAKLRRQANVLGRADPPDLVAVIDEPALRRLVGSAAIMYEQLVQVADLATRPYITVQVIPADNGANACMSGPLSIATGDGAPDVMHVDAVPEGFTVEKRAVVRKAAIAFDRVRGDALSQAQSRKLVLEVAEEWKLQI